ncbi:hypothetical protein [Treponema bryantii]|nr:hypothetical protein [Treponema bryantii]
MKREEKSYISQTLKEYCAYEKIMRGMKLKPLKYSDWLKKREGK